MAPGRDAAVPPVLRKALSWLLRPVFWLWLMVMVYTAFFLALNLTSHAAFDTSAYDLGIYDQVIWNTAHGRIMAYSAEPWFSNNFLGTHLQPILILLAPIYWIWSDPRALIVLQSLAVAASALLVYFLAAQRLGRPAFALALTFAYLMYPALQAVVHFEFHPEALEPLLFLSAFALYEIWRGRIKVRWLPSHRAAALFFLTIVLALAVKEDVAFVIAAFGIYLGIARRERWLGLTLVAAAALWFGVGMFLVMPHLRHGQGSPFLSYYAYLGKTPAEIVRTLLIQPEVAQKALLAPTSANMLLSLLLPLGLLSLLAPGILLIAAPTLVAYALSTNTFMHRMEGFHYAAPVIPWVTLAAIYGLGRWYDHARSGRLPAFAKGTAWLPIGVLLVASLAYQGARGFTPLSRFFQWPSVTEHQRVGVELMKEIPPGAALVAQDRLYPHLSQRQSISFLWPSDGSAEYILLDISDPALHNGDRLSEWLQKQVVEQSAYGLQSARDGFILLKRGAPPQALPDEFYSFARVTSPAIEHPLSVDTAEGIRFLGYDVLRKRDENTLLNLYFTATKPLAQDYFVGLHLLDTKGSTLAKSVFQQPTLVWYPTSRWRPGEVVKVVANTLGWPEEPERFGLGLVVAIGNRASASTDEPGQPEARLRWQSAANGTEDHLLEDQTVLWLGDFHK